VNAVAPRDRGLGGGADPPARGDGAVADTPAAEEAPRRPRAVFVSDFLHVAAPYSELAPKLLDPSAEWLDRLAALTKAPRFLVTAGEPRELSQTTTVPIVWTPTALDRLLPTLEADLQLSHLDGTFSRLSVNGRYRPPLATIGLTIDRLALHRVAEASLRKFLLEVEEALTSDP
jgi:hypothetical protein